MAAFEHIENMHDISLKPRLLRSLIKHHIPDADEKHPFRNPLDLSHVVSTLKTHTLLSESPTQPTDNKQIQNWKSAIDSWLKRLLLLVDSNMPDKCWAGICLLGVTCQECGSERFLASYSVWFNKLLSHIQLPTESHFVKVASCAAISDLFTRLGGFPNIKKDGTSHATKLIQSVLKLLNDDSSDAVWEGAVCLLCTIITFFPASVHRHYDSAEVAIVSKIMSGKCSVNMLKKLGHCLAILPKSRGDEDSWLLMMLKILLSINGHLNDAFQGLEEETKSNEAMRVLVPPGKDPPPPLGGSTMLETSDQTTKIPERLLMSSVSTLMLCCCTMLEGSYPVQITVPIQPLLMLAGRVLMVDGSLSQAFYPFVTAMQQEFICSELPVLHLYSLELLTAIVKGVRSQLLPHAADIARILTEYFRRCALPELRIKVYSIIRILVTSMGVGMALYLTQEVIYNAFVDLDPTVCSNARSKVSSSEAFLQPFQRKRKHTTTSGSLEEQPDTAGLEVTVPNTPMSISVKIAALEALEALLTVGGALRSESWRSNVDRLLITVATDACKGGWAKEVKDVFRTGESQQSWADFQLAALRALLASLLSFARVRPPYLAQGLELFRRGMKETGTRLAEFCAHALLALDVLIHPRALSLIDFDSVNRSFPENIYPDFQKSNISFSGPNEPDLDNDELYKSWLGNGDTEMPPVTFSGTSGEKLLSMDNSSGKKVVEESGQVEATTSAVERIEKIGDEIMIETQQVQETIPLVEREAVDATVSNSKTSKGFMFESDGESDSIPDIVDGDADSDSD